MKFASLLLVLLALLPVPMRAAVLELRAAQTVAGGNLTLNDLLQSSEGLSAEDLSSSIADAPSLGKSQTWTRDQIVKVLPIALQQQKIEWSGAESCEVNRPAVQCNERDVRQIITAELAKHLPENSDFAILETPGIESFPIPRGDLDARVQLGEGSLRHEWGDATIQFRYQGAPVVTKSVRFHWAYTRLVWQATNKIAAGDELSSSSFQQAEVNVLKLPGLLQPATDFPDGKAAAHALPQGKILMETDWVEPQLVARNDLVTILYAHHGISITVQGKALSNGTRNEVISVQNLTSHKVFNARIVDQRSLVYDE